MISAPSFSWFCGIKFTNLELERIQDVGMFKTFEKSLRGGISSIMGKRYVE